MIVVQGCQHSTVGPTIRGTYYNVGNNHGRPAYKRDVQVNGFDVMLYFWDERDGPAFSGWWFGPAVGGDQVWAYHAGKHLTSAPKGGWKVPYDGPVDPSLRIEGGAAVAGVGNRAVNGADDRAQGHGQTPQQMFTQQQQAANQQQQYMQQQQQQQMRMMQVQQGQQGGGQQQMHPQQQAQDEQIKMRQQAQMMEQQRRMAELKQKQDQIRQQQQQQEAMKQQWMEQQKQQLEAKRKEIEEQNRIQLEQQQKRMEELRQKQEEELARKRAEHQAVSEIRKGMQNLLVATSETLEDLNKALGSVLERELEKCGSLKERVQEEVARSREQAQQRVEQLEELRRKEEERRAAEAKRREELRVEASKKFENIGVLFDTFDEDNDGELNKLEIKAYAQKAHNLDLTPEDLAQIEKVLFPSSKGVKKADFQRLKMAIGIVREKALDLKRRAAREAREEEIAAMKLQLQEKVKQVTGSISVGNEAIAAAEQVLQKSQNQASTTTAVEMMAKVEEIDRLIQESKEKVAAIKKQMEEIRSVQDADLQPFAASEATQLEVRVRPLDVRLSRTATATSILRAKAKALEVLEIRSLKLEALRIIRHHQGEDGLSAEELFQAVDKDGDDKISESELLAFFATCKRPPAEEEAAPSSDAAADDSKADEKPPASELSQEEVRRFFKSVDYEDLGHLPKDSFLRLIRLWLTVVQDTFVTEGISLEDTATVRRLTVGEVIEAQGVPEKEESKGVLRVKAKMFKDGKEGYVTIVGSNGTKMLQEKPVIFKVVKDTILTESFDISGGSKDTTRRLKDTTRKLKEGEEVEVLEMPSKEGSADLMRLMCRAVSDGAVGWATSVGNSGIVFMEPVL